MYEFDDFKITSDVFERDKETGELVKVGKKTFGPAKKPLNKWIKRPKKTIVFPPMNGWQVYNKKARPDKTAEGSLCNMNSKSNGVQGCTFQYLCSGPVQAGWSILPENFKNSMIIFAARRLVKKTWLNDKDQFSVPDEEAEGYQQWALDAVIYALFHNSNQTSSLGPVEYKGKTYDITNEFFWLTVEELQADDRLPYPMYVQLKRAEDKFVAKWLEEHEDELSDDAKHVLHLGKRLLLSSLPVRENADEKYQLHRWDAGWYQVRNGLYDKNITFQQTGEMIEVWMEFKEAYKDFKERLRPGIYDYDFLPI